jgi:CRP-like cAMP-binding protein
MNKSVTVTSKFFAQINDPLVVFDLLGQMGREVFMPGDRIMSEGEVEPILYILLKGSVQVFKFHTALNEEVLLSTLHRDAILGERGLLGHRRSATVIAATYCDTLVCA